MLGPVEGLKVLIEVDATRAQAVLREFSGSVALAGSTAAAGLSPAQKGVNDLLDQIGDTKRRAEELETAMRNTASGAGAAASGMTGLSSIMSSMLPIMGAMVGLGIAKMLWDAAKSTDEMKEALASLKEATTNAKTGLGEMVVEATGLNRELLALAGTIQLVTNALQPKEGEFGAGIWTERSRPLLDWLSENAPKPVNYGEAPGLLSDESKTWERIFKELEKGVATNKRLATIAREVKVELTGVAAALESWIQTAVKGQAVVDMNRLLGLDENGKFPMLDASTMDLDSIVGGIDGVTEATRRLGETAPAAFQDFTQGVETAAGSAVTLGEYVSSTFAQFEEAMYTSAGVALYAAISGEQSTKKVLKALLDSIGREAAIQAIFEAAKSVASYAMYDYYAGSLHAKAAGIFAAVAVGAGVASRQIDTSSGGGGGGRKDKGDISPRPTILPPEHEPQITIIIDGNVIGQEEYVRQLALDAAREMRKAGA